MARVLGPIAALLLLAGLAAAFGYAPRDAIQGNVQRIMYLHVPAILTAYVAIGIVLVASIGYLWSRRPVWDRAAAAAGELAVCFIALTLITGSIWGKPTWGTWWTWDARLTSVAVVLVMFLA
jgi:heme exporter protein C